MDAGEEEQLPELPPTYGELEAEAEAQGGESNTRWQRWRGWIEKRAAERYVEEGGRTRLATGWGPSVHDEPEPESGLEDLSTPIATTYNNPSGTPPLRRQSTRLSIAPPSYDPPPNPEVPPAFLGQPIEPCHASLHTFGSRFLSHAPGQIHCLLPILEGKFLLLGHANGLSVLDVLPSLHPPGNTNPNLRPEEADAVALPLWVGEAVYQLDLLEGQDEEGGVVLALCGPAEDELTRCIRMYQLTSLCSLVRWFASQQDYPPLDLLKFSPQASTPSQTARARLRKARHHSDIARGFKALIVDELKVSSPSSSSSPPPVVPPNLTIPTSPSSISVESANGWDVVDDLPLRWATDFVPFPLSKDKMVCFYQLWSGARTTFLAVVTRTNILLYETKKTERAFKFIKDFYTPLPAKSVSFVQQTDRTLKRGSSKPRESSRNSLHRRGSSSSKRADYGVQPCLFVVFEKKAGLIRIGDASVMEVDPFPDVGESTFIPSHRSRPSASSFTNPEPNSSTISRSFWKSHTPWLPLIELLLPPSISPSLDSICFITRGKTTQVYPLPLPMAFNGSPDPPIKTLTWQYQPSKIQARITATMGLQLLGFGEHGVELQETTFEFLSQPIQPKGKARETPSQVLRAYADVGGPAGHLCVGGHWDRPISAGSPTWLGTGQTGSPSVLSRADTWSSTYDGDESAAIGSTTSHAASVAQTRAALNVGGVYGWSMKGSEDFRVFWMGDLAG